MGAETWFSAEEGASQLYLRAWRPGAYARGTPDKRAQLRAEWEDHHRERGRLVVERRDNEVQLLLGTVKNDRALLSPP